ncbi:DUF305 domain-containing protein [Roseomonas sp. GCM10028921]
MTAETARRPRLATPAAFLAALLVLAAPARALVGEGEDSGIHPPLLDIYTVAPATALPAVLKADRDYLTGMRAHHAGALTMSEDYLADPEARSPALRQLAYAIIVNQRYEIALMDEVARKLDQPPGFIGSGPARLAIQPAATETLAQQLRYARAPIPGPLTPASPPDRPMSVRDVQFAKAMTIHHQAALEMARAYQADPNARNSFLGLLNVDILTDQSQEIAFMRRTMGAYPRDVEAVPVPASMIHGMEGMSHGGHGGHGGGAQPASADTHAGHAPRAGEGAGHAGGGAASSGRRSAPRRGAPERGGAHHAH